MLYLIDPSIYQFFPRDTSTMRSTQTYCSLDTLLDPFCKVGRSHQSRFQETILFHTDKHDSSLRPHRLRLKHTRSHYTLFRPLHPSPEYLVTPLKPKIRFTLPLSCRPQFSVEKVDDTPLVRRPPRLTSRLFNSL